MPRLVAAFLLVTLSSIALPGMNGFVGEFLILLGAFRWHPQLTAFAATGVILSAVYMLWMFQRVNYGAVTNEKNRSLPDLAPREWAHDGADDRDGDLDGRRSRTSSCGRWSRRSSRVVERVTGSQAGARLEPAIRRPQPYEHAGCRVAGRATRRAREPTPRPTRAPTIMSDYAAIIPMVIVVLSAIAAMLAEAFRQPGERMPIFGLGLIGLVGRRRLLRVAVGHRRPQLRRRPRPTTSRSSSTSILCIIGILTMLFSTDVVEREGLPPGEYYALTLFAISGMMLMAAATDLLVIFLALEVLSLAVYVLTGLRRASAAGAEAAFKYFLLGAFSSAFFLYGIAFAFAVSGSTRLEQIGTALSPQARARRRRWRCSPSGLLAVGFAFKVSAVPFHMWTPDAYEGAPTIVTAFMSTGVKAAAFAAFVRVFLSPLEPLQAQWIPVLSVIAAADDDPRHGRRRGADQRQADARLFEHRARRLPAARHHRGERRPARPRSSSTCWPTRSRTSARSASSRCSARRRTSTTSCATSPGCGNRGPALAGSDDGVPALARRLSADRRLHRQVVHLRGRRPGTRHYWLAIIGVLTSVVSVFFYLRIVVMMYMTEGSETSRPRVPGAALAGLALATAGGVLPRRPADASPRPRARLDRDDFLNPPASLFPYRVPGA